MTHNASCVFCRLHRPEPDKEHGHGDCCSCDGTAWLWVGSSWPNVAEDYYPTCVHRSVMLYLSCEHFKYKRYFFDLHCLKYLVTAYTPLFVVNTRLKDVVSKFMQFFKYTWIDIHVFIKTVQIWCRLWDRHWPWSMAYKRCGILYLNSELMDWERNGSDFLWLASAASSGLSCLSSHTLLKQLEWLPY